MPPSHQWNFKSKKVEAPMKLVQGLVRHHSIDNDKKPQRMNLGGSSGSLPYIVSSVVPALV